MTKIEEIINWMNERFPLDTACDWDNSGLIVGSKEGLTDSVVLALDLTSKTIDLAINKEAKLIITHHPMIFGGIKTVLNDEPTGRLISGLIKNDISCFASHTNLDANHEYSNAILARKLGADSYEELSGAFCGVVCNISSISLADLSKRITQSLNSCGVITINNPQNKVSKLFVQGGSFDEDVIPELIKAGIDTVVSGEIKHHITVLLEEYGINSVIAGHNATERVFMTNLATEMQKSFSELEIFVDNGNETIII